MIKNFEGRFKYAQFRQVQICVIAQNSDTKLRERKTFCVLLQCKWRVPIMHNKSPGISLLLEASILLFNTCNTFSFLIMIPGEYP
jgi:hypothetical protein